MLLTTTPLASKSSRSRTKETTRKPFMVAKRREREQSLLWEDENDHLLQRREDRLVTHLTRQSQGKRESLALVALASAKERGATRE